MSQEAGNTQNPISPDGNYVWNGAQWVPLQVSPDGKYVWNGAQWVLNPQPPIPSSPATPSPRISLSTRGKAIAVLGASALAAVGLAIANGTFSEKYERVSITGTFVTAEPCGAREGDEVVLFGGATDGYDWGPYNLRPDLASRTQLAQPAFLRTSATQDSPFGCTYDFSFPEVNASNRGDDVFPRYFIILEGEALYAKRNTYPFDWTHPDAHAVLHEDLRDAGWQVQLVD